MVRVGLIDAQDKDSFIVKIMVEQNRQVPILINDMINNLSSVTKNCNSSIDKYGASWFY